VLLFRTLHSNVIGLGTKKNLEVAIKFYMRAIEIGNDLDARYQLGGIHFEREEFELAAQHFEFTQDTHVEALGKLGNGLNSFVKNSFSFLGYMSYFGKGVLSSKTLGLEKLSIAADLGDTFSQFQLASIYYLNLLREMKPGKKKKFAFDTEDVGGIISLSDIYFEILINQVVMS
jgi:TPR repeat protein